MISWVSAASWPKAAAITSPFESQMVRAGTRPEIGSSSITIFNKRENWVLKVQRDSLLVPGRGSGSGKARPGNAIAHIQWSFPQTILWQWPPRALLSNSSKNVNWQTSLEMSIWFPERSFDRLEKMHLELPLCFSLCLIQLLNIKGSLQVNESSF